MENFIAELEAERMNVLESYLVTTTIYFNNRRPYLNGYESCFEYRQPRS
jgi:hypothetical protein